MIIFNVIDDLNGLVSAFNRDICDVIMIINIRLIQDAL